MIGGGVRLERRPPGRLFFLGGDAGLEAGAPTVQYFSMTCALCRQRKPKRYCPGVRGHICSLCCGRERENTVDCPLDCPYLQEAHRYEFERTKTPVEIPYSKYELTDEFLREREPFIGALALRLLERSLEQRGTLDSDLLAALDSLIRTWETLASGLYYESLPDTPSAQAHFRGLQDFIEEFRRQENERGHFAPLKDEDVLKSLVFLARLGRARTNGRPRAKGYLDFLRQQFPKIAAQKRESRLILPG